MGMDINGKSGNYFRASMWSWPPLLGFIRAAVAERGVDFEEIQDWDYNFVPGLRTEEDCELLATILDDAIAKCRAAGQEQFYADKPGCNGDVFLEVLKQILPEENIISGETISTTLDHIAEFSKFVRECGGEFYIY